MPTTPSAELMITPEVSRAAIIAMQKDFDKGFKKVADDADRQISKGVREGIKDGLKKSKSAIRGAFKGLRSGANRAAGSIGGAGGIASGILGIGTLGLVSAIDRAGQGSELVAQLLGEQNAGRQIATAKNAGFTLSEFTAFSRTLERGGFTEQQDINDIIFDIQERTADAETGGNPVLKQFVGLEGRELINSVLASISGLEGNKQAFALAELGFGGETGQNLLRVLQVASENGELSVDDTKTALDESSKTEGERLASILEKQATLSDEFRRKSLEHADKQTERLLNELSSGTIASFFEELKAQDEKQANLLVNFDENQVLATAANVKIEALMTQLNETTNRVADATEGLLQKFGLVEGEAKEESVANIVRGVNPFDKAGRSIGRTIAGAFE